MEEPKLLKEIISEAMSFKEMQTEDIAKETGVPERFIIGFIDGNYKILPAAPYTRGYLNKVCKILELDQSEIWRTYERESSPKKSGINDTLPMNRFAIKTAGKKIPLLIPIIIVVAIYLLINGNKLIATPNITISEPLKELTTAYTPSVIIKGRVDNPKDIVSINGASIYVDEFGEFKKEFFLDQGNNTFDIVAEKFLGRSSKKTVQVIYETPEETETQTSKEADKPNIN